MPPELEELMCTRVALAVAALLIAGPVRAQESMSKEMGMKKESMSMTGGHFAGAEGHKAGGSLTLERGALEFGKDFAVDHGADVWIALSNGPKVVEGSSLFLGKLSSFKGAQRYPIPEGTDLSKYTHVVLWSKGSGAALGSAMLPHGDMKHGMMKHEDMKKDAMEKEMKQPDTAMPKQN